MVVSLLPSLERKVCFGALGTKYLVDGVVEAGNHIGAIHKFDRFEQRRGNLGAGNGNADGLEYQLRLQVELFGEFTASVLQWVACPFNGLVGQDGAYLCENLVGAAAFFQQILLNRLFVERNLGAVEDECQLFGASVKRFMRSATRG